MSRADTYKPGGDARAISRVAKEAYGGFRQMFAAHGWRAAGDKLMISAPALIVEHYGTIRAFEIAHQKGHGMDDHLPEDIWGQAYSVLFTSFWGWSPEDWGTVGWSGDLGFPRRRNLLAELTDPFITVCYVTSNKSDIDPDLKGKVAGFYLVSHQTGDRDEFTHPIRHRLEPDKWRHSLKALRAFSYLPEYRLSVSELDAGLLSRARSVSAMGEILTVSQQIELLRKTPFIEVDVYASTGGADAKPNDAASLKGMVRAGPASNDGYVVSDGTQWLPRELYILRLNGDIGAFLGKPADGQAIIKVGLSASPEMRRQSIQKAMPRGAFEWQIDRTTTSTGRKRYPGHAVAVKGENAMKRHLAAHADWLGGEFYLASKADIESAWDLGCQAAETDVASQE